MSEETNITKVHTPIDNIEFVPMDCAGVCIKPPKIQIGDEWATFKDCASLQEFFDKVQTYAKLQKALDVATGGLCDIRDWDADIPGQPLSSYPYQVRAIQRFSHNKLQKIDKIMKEGVKEC